MGIIYGFCPSPMLLSTCFRNHFLNLLFIKCFDKNHSNSSHSRIFTSKNYELLLELRQYKNGFVSVKCMLVLKLPPFFPCRVDEGKRAAISKQTWFSQKRVRSYIVLALMGSYAPSHSIKFKTTQKKIGKGWIFTTCHIVLWSTFHPNCYFKSAFKKAPG